MRSYRGGDPVERGLYLDLKRGSLQSLRDGGSLPGTQDDVYWRLPPLAFAIAAPVLGGLYVVSLPVVGFVFLVGIGVARLFQFTVGIGRALARVLKPSWTPAGALLAARKRPGSAKKGPDPWADAVERRLAEGSGQARPDAGRSSAGSRAAPDSPARR